ncbi:MAG: hypothetical protein FJZ63_03260 [Chlamydiae bacterium]|nr:hypothetical protein [Chlamydiota bacterium]
MSIRDSAQTHLDQASRLLFSSSFFEDEPLLRVHLVALRRILQQPMEDPLFGEELQRSVVYLEELVKSIQSTKPLVDTIRNTENLLTAFQETQDRPSTWEFFYTSFRKQLEALKPYEDIIEVKILSERIDQALDSLNRQLKKLNADDEAAFQEKRLRPT